MLRVGKPSIQIIAFFTIYPLSKHTPLSMKRTIYSFVALLVLLSPQLWGQSKKSIRTVHPSMHATLLPNGHNKEVYDRCGFIQSNNLDNPERRAQLDAWEKVLQEKIAERKRKREAGTLRTEETVYIIPVIVHVVHNGEPVGEGANISAEQVYSQIEVLNEDFRALNADLDETRDVYRPLAGDTKVTFAPALVDPEGNPLEEAGIQRYNGGQASWSVDNFDTQVKPSTQFDPYRYANLWTAPLSGGLLGYAQFPLDPVVPGIPSGDPDSEISDGVVMGYQYFGSIEKVNTPQLQEGAPFNLGRTATHEVGHWLGLRHIWGDGDCGVDDQVADTPTQGSSSSGCPADDASTCGELDMWENYMDYTDDGCMSLFTQGQADRMRTVIELDDMRDQLMDSDVPVLGNSYFSSQDRRVCAGGTVEFTSVVEEGFSIVQWEFEGGTPATSTEPNPSIVYNSEGIYDVSLTIRGGDNDTTIVLSTEDYIRVQDLGNSQALPLAADFESGIPEGWSALSEGGWTSSEAGLNSSGALVIDHFNNVYEEPQELSSPIADLRNEQNGLNIRFDLAYPSGATAIDGLEVGYIDPCSGDYTQLWRESGSELSTGPETESLFIPSSADDWQEVGINIFDVSDIDYAQFIIQGRGNNGNALYIDNISVTSAEGAIPDFDIDTKSLVCPGVPISFTNTSSFFGSPESVSWSWQFEEGLPATSTEESPSGIIFTMPGTYDITLSATIDGEVYSAVFEEAIEVLDLAAQPTAYEELFDDEVLLEEDPRWEFTEEGWVETLPPLGALVIDNYNIDLSGVEVVAKLPNISFQGNQNASFTFDVAYAAFEGFGAEVYDDLAILYSTDCGETFTPLTEIPGEELSTAPATGSAFVPGDDDWKTISIPLYNINEGDTLAGIRFAIQGIGNYGNIIWMDNIRIETFSSAAPTADFYAVPYPQPEDEGSVIKQTKVEFKDESLRFPKFWTWSFEGGNPAVSNEKNPEVFYEEPGVYNVSLTVSNAFGTGTLTKSSYLVVEEVESGESVLLDNTAGNEVFDASDGFGYVAGNNNYEDAAVAERFDNPAPYTELTKVDLGFLEATPNASGNGAENITMNVWAADAEGAPGDIIASVDIPFEEATITAEAETILTVNLDEPINITGEFFIGIETPYNGDVTATPYEGDIVALRSDEVSDNTAWTLFGDGTTWLPFSDADNWGGNTSRALWIFPALENNVVTGLSNSGLSEQLTVFPNPNSGQVRVKGNGLRLQAYTVIDMLGKTVKAGAFQQNEADLSGLPNGLYFLKVQTPKGNALKKVMIQK